MAMNRTKRVIYEKNPLLEVIIQVRFPKILSINVKEPVDFQDAIRDKFPIYDVSLENEHEFTIGEGMPFPSIIQQQQHKNHNFITEDRTYKVNLTDGFIAFSTVNYTRWEEMLSCFENPMQQLISIYRPAFFERVGLRYVDCFSRSKLGVQNRSWKELIEPAYLGAMCSLDEEKVVANTIDVSYMLDNGVSQAKIHAGLGNVNDDPETVFIIDSDFIHAQNIKPNEFNSIIDYLHTNAGNFIRSAITENLHEAMGPGDLT